MLLLMVAPWSILTRHRRPQQVGGSGVWLSAAGTPVHLPTVRPAGGRGQGPRETKDSMAAVKSTGLGSNHSSAPVSPWVFSFHSPVSSPSRGSLARPSCPMMYCGRSVLMPCPLGPGPRQPPAGDKTPRGQTPGGAERLVSRGSVSPPGLGTCCSLCPEQPEGRLQLSPPSLSA